MSTGSSLRVAVLQPSQPVENSQGRAEKHIAHRSRRGLPVSSGRSEMQGDLVSGSKPAESRGVLEIREDSKDLFLLELMMGMQKPLDLLECGS